jgi:hypothetical protein
LEFAIIVSQALAAVWFYKLFKDINHTAAWALAAWGTVNAVAIMISAMAMGGALGIANSASAVNEKVMMIQILEQFIKNAWGVGSLFFGLLVNTDGLHRNKFAAHAGVVRSRFNSGRGRLYYKHFY